MMERRSFKGKQAGMLLIATWAEEMEGVCEFQGMSTDITAAETRLSSPTTWDSVLLQEKN